jgi:hypothetical protein
MDGDDFFVQGRKRTEAPKTVQDTSLRSIWQLMRGKQAVPQEEAKPSPTAVEMRYTPDDIARLDAEELSSRKASAGNAEAHSLSQILRAVGAFVDQKGGRFLAVKKEDLTITIEYESALKRKISEELTVASLYDFWVRMYKRRTPRSGL